MVHIVVTQKPQTAMALSSSSVPSNFLSPSPKLCHPPPSLFFLKLHTQTHSLKTFRPQKLKLVCCHRTDELATEAHPMKRKPKPSFVEQIQNKWSVKNPSPRQNFPWQEQEIRDTNPKSDGESVGDPVISRVRIKSTLAPWAHGNEPTNKVFDSEGSRVSQAPDNLTKLKVTPARGRGREREETPIGAPRNRAAGILKSGSVVDPNASKRMPWEKKNTAEEPDKSWNRNTMSAERLIPEHELKRLRNVSLRMAERMRVGSSGVTQDLVDAIHEKWKHDEVVKLKFEGPPSMHMKRTHEFLESRTGGLVIWRSGGLVVLYRGMGYKLDCVKSYSEHVEADSPKSFLEKERVNGAGESSRVYSSSYFNNLSKDEQVDLRELDLLLDELGPRFKDWSGREPIPVDADLLPAVVPGYKTPFRLLPHGTRHALWDKEMTHLRQIARIMPPHFALGRNRELQGLAMAMAKLWEKSAIAKIAIKRGVLNTSNERMAEELKILTGGTLVSRNKEFIVFYRGKDFLPPKVSNALVEAEKMTTLKQDEEEEARKRAASLIDPRKKSEQRLVAGTLTETLAATSRWSNQTDRSEMEKMMRDEAVARHGFIINSVERKLALAKGKIRMAEKALRKLLEKQEPENLPTDLETLTDEERFLFRRIGLSMKPYLVLGRREIFDGTIENMHLHWKYRELVKILVERKTFSQVRHIALSLEAESGGVLVTVERTPKGYVVIVYRGKNYQMPLAFRPKNLLTKRQALARSIVLQRREALKHHVLELEEKIEKLEQELEDMKTVNNSRQGTSDSKVNSVCDFNDDESVDTVECEHAHLQEYGTNQ